MGGGFVNGGGRSLHAITYRDLSNPGLWVFGVLDGVYLKMVEVTVTVFAENAYAYVSGARMATGFPYRSLVGYGSMMYSYYYTNSFVCMTGGFGLCTKPVSSYADPGFGVPSLEYSIHSPPTSTPTTSPTALPTAVPSSLPTSNPTILPSSIPSVIPTSTPTTSPTSIPTTRPTSTPTVVPSNVPSSLPSTPPSATPSSLPSSIPTSSPTYLPSAMPSSAPTKLPSSMPTSIPTKFPTATPTACKCFVGNQML